MIDKLDAQVTTKIESDLHADIAALAEIDGLTVSALTRQLLIDYREKKRGAYQDLSRVFGSQPDLPGKPQETNK